MLAIYITTCRSVDLPRLRILVAVDVQGAAQTLGAAEEDACLAGGVQLADALEDHVPVGAAKVGRAAEARDGVGFSVGVVDHDVGRVVALNLGREVGVNLDAVLDVLRLDGHEQRAEPLKGAKVAADPEEVDLGQPRLLLRVVHAVPDGLEDRGKRRDADAGADEDGHLVLEDVLGRGAKGPVNVDAREHAVQRRVDAVGGLLRGLDADHLARVAPLPPLAAQSGRDGHGEVALAAHVDGDVVLLGRAGEREGVVLPERDGGAAEEDVLAGARLCVLLFDLNLADLARVLDDLCYVRLVAAADLAGDALGQVAEAAVHPKLPKDANGRGADAGAKGRDVGLDHAKGAVQGPEEEEDDEHVVRVPEALVVGAARLLDRRDDHAHEGEQHHVAGPAGARGKVGEQPAVEAQVVLGRHLGKVVPVGNGVHPRPKDNGPGGRDVKGDVLVKLDDAVEGRLPQQRDERAAHGEQHDADVDVQHQRRGAGHGKGEAKDVARARERILEAVVDAAKGKDEAVGNDKDEDEAGWFISFLLSLKFRCFFFLLFPSLNKCLARRKTYNLR